MLQVIIVFPICSEKIFCLRHSQYRDGSFRAVYVWSMKGFSKKKNKKTEKFFNKISRTLSKSFSTVSRNSEHGRPSGTCEPGLLCFSLQVLRFLLFIYLSRGISSHFGWEKRFSLGSFVSET